MTSNGHLAPSPHTNNDPFATPSRGSASYDGGNNWSASAQQPMEMQDQGASQFGAAAPAGKPSFMQRWRAADDRMYLATIGNLGSGRRGGSEKQLAANAGVRRRRPAFLCSLILGLLLLVVIIAIVVPIAVVFGTKNSSSESMGSGSSSPNGTTPQPQNGNVVTVQNGQYQGTNMGNGVSSFLGMQYAAPPTGNLRWAAPQAPVNFTGVKAATKYAPACHSLGDFNSKEDEDCLYLDVYTPTNATKNSKLPVYVFIQGGGLQNAAAHYNATNLIKAGGFGFITVAMTYRVNAFGFLASTEIQNNASLNNGLKDQRYALQWVQQNIAQFGGDPNHVVMAGQSGGAGSVVNLLAAYGGRDDHLFQAATMQSQSVQPIRDVKSSQFQYDYIVGNTSCHNTKTDTLSCLQGISVQELVGAIKNSPFPNGAGGNPVFPYNPVLDQDMILEYPVSAFANGHFVNVPMIFGDDTDEGTIFVSNRKSFQSKTDSEDYLQNTFPKLNSTTLDKISGYYNFSDGIGADDYWTKASTAYGELRYICPGMQLSSYVQTNNSKVWNYRYDVKDPTSEAAGNGVKHGSEMPAIWGTGSAPDSYQVNQENYNVIPVMQGYWTSFIKHFDPNAEKHAGTPTWEAWTGNNRLHVLTNDTAMEKVDDAQATRCSYLASIATSIGQ